VAPTDASTALTGFTDLGYLSEDGVTNSLSTSSTPIKAWQNNATVRTIITDGTETFQCVFIETKAETVGLYYGGTVDADGSIVSDPGANTPEQKMVFEYVDGAKLVRAYAPKAQVTERGDTVWRNGEPVGYEVTITCNVDGTLGGSVKRCFSALDTTP
jgi:hypothetical protein